jgi:radical SAM protein with 4Fe4S-binding SPASM domain
MTIMLEQLNKINGREYWKFFLEQEQISSELFYFDNKITDRKSKEIFKKYVCIVNLETSTACNRKCDYCPLSIHERKEQVLIDDKLFSKIIAALASINYYSTISLNLYNEPLLDPEIYSRIKEVREKCPNSFIKFNSNGDYLTREVLDKLVEVGLNAIFITLHIPKGKTYFDGERLFAFKKFFEKLELEFIINEIIPNEKIVSDVYYNDMRLLIESHNWSLFGNDRGGLIDFLSSQYRTTPCVRPIREFAIAYDGVVYPCCQFFTDSKVSNKSVIGKIDQNVSIFNIYTSNILTRWRKRLFTYGEKQKPCATCRDQDFSIDNTTEKRKSILEQMRIKRRFDYR